MPGILSSSKNRCSSAVSSTAVRVYLIRSDEISLLRVAEGNLDFITASVFIALSSMSAALMSSELLHEALQSQSVDNNTYNEHTRNVPFQTVFSHPQHYQ